MSASPSELSDFEREVARRFDLVPNFFTSAPGAPEVIEKLWDFAKSAYLDNPIPSLFKERLFVYLSRFCEVRYCILRHCGFLLGYGHSSGDPTVEVQTIAQAIQLLKKQTPWQRSDDSWLAALEASPNIEVWPDSETELEDQIFAAAAIVFGEPGRAERTRRALRHALGDRRYEHLMGLLAFIRTAHYWTVVHPDLAPEEDIGVYLSINAELARLLLEDPEAARCDMGTRLFTELTDLRELRRAQLELTDLREQLAQAERVSVLGHLASALAHELVQPLTATAANVDAGRMELEKEEPDLEELRAILEDIGKDDSRAADILTRMRQFARRHVIDMQPLAVEDVVQDVIALVHSEAINKHAVLALVIQPDLPRVLGDRVHLCQVLLNLIVNSIHAVESRPIDERGIVIEARTGEANDEVEVAVRDSGPGIPDNLAGEVFKPFFTTKSNGMGMGLALSRTIVEAHGGRLWTDRMPQQDGAVFRFTLKRVS
jgi:signal transduction histidine kinase